MLKRQWNLCLDNLGLRVSSLDALPQLAMLAIPVSLMPAADLARHIQESESADETAINLLEIPATRLEFAGIDFQATLHEALIVLNETKKEVLYVTRHTIPGIKRIHGILTRETIDKSYHVQGAAD